jgi:hypothetical protein
LKVEAGERLDYLLREARRTDRGRYLAALFAPPERRPAVLALTVLHAELGRAVHQASQPMLALIRLQWWREAVEEAGRGEPRAHPVGEALAEAMRHGFVTVNGLAGLIDVHEAVVEGPSADPETPEGELQALILKALGGGHEPDELQAARHVGLAYGLNRSGADSTGAHQHLIRARALVRCPTRERMPAFLPARVACPSTSASGVLALSVAWLRRRY